MPRIEDTGKVWFPGTFSPEYALRVGEVVFVAGKKESESIHAWVDANALCVDLNDPVNARRTARRFALDLTPERQGTLFGGFENTQHGDVAVITHRSPGVEEVVVEGESYREQALDSLDSASFWALVFGERPPQQAG